MVKEKELKELEIPYIGVKIDAMPTILKVLSESKNDEDFIRYYENIGKKPKTASEYLRSLRNIGLASIDKNKQTNITNDGLIIINDSPELVYDNIYKIIIKKIPELKVIKGIVDKYKNCTLPQLRQYLADEGYYVKREQTLSSYLKLFAESNKLKRKDIARRSFVRFDNEVIELKQFKEYLKAISQKENKTIFTFKELKKQFKKDKIIINENIKNHFLTLERLNFINLYYFHSSLANEVTDYVTIKDKYYYKLEIVL